jgi:hypothetical protein
MTRNAKSAASGGPGKRSPGQEVRLLKATARRILATPEASARLLLSIGMYQANGRLKREYR